MPGVRADIIVICCLKKAQCGAGVCIVNLDDNDLHYFHFTLLLSVNHDLHFTSLTENFELGTSLAVASIFATVTVLFSAKASPTCMACSNSAKTGCRLLLTGAKVHCPCLCTCLPNLHGMQQFGQDWLHAASYKWQVTLPLSSLCICLCATSVSPKQWTAAAEDDMTCADPVLIWKNTDAGSCTWQLAVKASLLCNTCYTMQEDEVAPMQMPTV